MPVPEALLPLRVGHRSPAERRASLLRHCVTYFRYEFPLRISVTNFRYEMRSAFRYGPALRNRGRSARRLGTLLDCGYPVPGTDEPAVLISSRLPPTAQKQARKVGALRPSRPLAPWMPSIRRSDDAQAELSLGTG